MVENITIDNPKHGHAYKGWVDNYPSPNNRPGEYNLILRTTNQRGEQVIIKEWHLKADTSHNCPRKFEFQFTWKSEYRNAEFANMRT